MENVLLSKEFKSDKLTFSEYQQNKDSATGSVKLGYRIKSSEPDRLIIQSARMRVPFGITNNEKYADGKKLKWSIQLSFDNEHSDPRIASFRKCITDLDNAVIQKGFENCGTWLKNTKHTLDSIRMAYASALKVCSESKAGKYADTIKVSIPWDTSVDEETGKERDQPSSWVEFFDENGNEVTWEYVVPNCEVKVVFSVPGVWCSPGIRMFGTNFKLVQMQVFKPKKIKGFNIKSDEIESDTEENIEADEESLEESTPKKPVVEDESSDDDDDDEEDEDDIE
jgi:hypothetical protein